MLSWPVLYAIFSFIQLGGAGGKLFRVRPAMSPNVKSEVINQLSSGLRPNPNNARLEKYEDNLFKVVREKYGISETSFYDDIKTDNIIEVTNTDSKGGQPMWRLKHGGIVLKCVVSDAIVAVVYTFTLY